MLEAKNINFSYGSKQVLKDISVKLAENKITTLIGPNGSGKSTLFKLLTRSQKAASGQVVLAGKDIWQYSARDFAKKVTIVHQKNDLYDDLTVEDLIKMGRLPYVGLTKEIDNQDEVINQVIDYLELEPVKNKLVSRLSGGQQQRVWLGLALAQQPDYLFLDEPTTYLDLHFQMRFLNLLKKLNQTSKLTICMILHDLNQALRYSDQVVLLSQGKIKSQGLPEMVITEANVKASFDINCRIIDTEDGKFFQQLD